MFSLSAMAESFAIMDNSKDVLGKLKAELDPIVEEIEQEQEEKEEPLKLVHSVSKGVHLVGDTYPHKNLLKKVSGLRYKGRMKIWGVTNTVGKPCNKNVLYNYQHKLKAVGLDVSIEITEEDTQAEIKKHLENKAERLEEKAERYEEASNHYYQKRKAIGDRIPFGQPILVGHHSQGRMERDAKAIHRNMEKCVHFSDKAQAARNRLKSVKAKLAPSIQEKLNQDDRQKLDKFIKGCKKTYTLIRSVRTSKSEFFHTWVILFHDSSLCHFRVELKPEGVTIADYNWSNREHIETIDEAEKHIILRLEDAHNKHEPIVIDSEYHRFTCDYNNFSIRVFDGKNEFYLHTSNAKPDNMGLSKAASLKVYTWANQHFVSSMLKSISPTTDKRKLVAWFERELKSVLGHSCIFHTCPRY